MLMLLIACASRGFCLSLSICPWRETQELFPICPPLPSPSAPRSSTQSSRETHNILFNSLCPRQSMILHSESNNRMSGFECAV